MNAPVTTPVTAPVPPAKRSPLRRALVALVLGLVGAYGGAGSWLIRTPERFDVGTNPALAPLLAVLALGGGLLAVLLGWRARRLIRQTRPSFLASAIAANAIFLGGAGAVATILPRSIPLLPGSGSEALVAATSLRCASNLRQVGIAVRLYAMDWGDTNPPSLLVLSNEIGKASLLACPAEPSRTAPASINWAAVTAGNISYHYFLPGEPDAGDPSRPLLLCPIHHHLILADGSISPPGPRGINPHLQSNWIANWVPPTPIFESEPKRSTDTGAETPLPPDAPSTNRSGPPPQTTSSEKPYSNSVPPSTSQLPVSTNRPRETEKSAVQAPLPNNPPRTKSDESPAQRPLK